MSRVFAALLALVLAVPALAQVPARQVELLAPQLVTFAGSRDNFESLVNGLTQGTPVTLTSTARGGVLEIATFAPGTPLLTATEAAQALETARQGLIARGIVRPGAALLASAVTGANIPIQVRTERARRAAIPAGGDVDRLLRVRHLHFSPHHVQALHRHLGLPGSLTSFEAAQALQLANFHLALQGIFQPTPAELQAALFGGELARGSVIPIRGILEGRRLNTSHSPYFGTSDTPNLQPIISPPPVIPKVPLHRVEGRIQVRR